ncbi:hypothetical protein BU196_27915 [Streptomyces sp. CBMA370]|nr:hypothetical protein [Streptomyces sp. CBMA370]
MIGRVMRVFSGPVTPAGTVARKRRVADPASGEAMTLSGGSSWTIRPGSTAVASAVVPGAVERAAPGPAPGAVEEADAATAVPPAATGARVATRTVASARLDVLRVMDSPDFTDH